MRDQYLRGQAAPIPATADQWTALGGELTKMRAICRAEKAMYGRVTPHTAQALAELLARAESAVVIDEARESAKAVQS